MRECGLGWVDGRGGGVVLLLGLVVLPREVWLRPADLGTKGRKSGLVLMLRMLRVLRDGRWIA